MCSLKSRFGSHYDCLPIEDKEIRTLHLAMEKLLDSKQELKKEDNLGSLACLAVQFALEFNEDEESQDISCKQVEWHMRLCLFATTGFRKMVTGPASEPLLAEAAFWLLQNSDASLAKHLMDHSNLYCIDHGWCGKLVAALIVMQAQDASVPRSVPDRQWISVSKFMQTLLPPEVYKDLLISLPTCWHPGEGDISFHQMFDNYHLWFNHIIRVEDSNMIRLDFLWKYIIRGAMVLCKDTQEGIDMILLVCLMDGEISHETVTSITIQVKSSKEYTLSIKKKLFDGMDMCCNRPY